MSSVHSVRTLLLAVILSLIVTLTTVSGLPPSACPGLKSMDKVDFKTYLPGKSFRSFIDVTLGECVRQCGRRGQCKSVNYHFRLHFCLLNTDSGSAPSLTSLPGFAFYQMEEWSPKCDELSCADEETCHDDGCGYEECPALSATGANRVVRGNKFSVGRKLLLKCDPGYQLSAQSTTASLTCLGTGQWSGNSSCQPLDCGPPPATSNGIVSYPANTVVGTIATYTCNTGYDLSGTATRTCQPTGSWGGSVPSCIPDCGPPSATSNGIVSYPSNTVVGTIATYTCNTGYDLSGTATRTCLPTGSWDGSVPSCIPAPVGCPPQWIEFSEATVCYSPLQPAASWTNAQTACEDMGATLVEIINQQVQYFVAGEVAVGGYYWTGGYFNNGVYDWLSGADRSYIDTLAVGANPSDTNCLYYYVTASQLYATPCTTAAPYICQTAL